MSRFLIIVGFLFFFLTNSKGQNVIIKEEPLITSMMEKFTALNKASGNIEGWRIQILATTDRQRMENVKQTFQYRYPNIPIDWEHKKPYYKLRAGAFATKLEAMRLKYILDEEYPGTYPVKDGQIKPSELISF